MATVELTADNFESTVTGGGLVLIAKAREIDMDEVRRTLVQPAAS